MISSRPVLWAIALALIVGSTTAESATAKKRPPRASPGISAVEECVKQQGGSYDPVRKKWMIHDYSEMGGTAKADALRDCLSRKTGTARGQIPVPTYYIDRPGMSY